MAVARVQPLTDGQRDHVEHKDDGDARGEPVLGRVQLLFALGGDVV